jgi:hypothetical protein
MKVASGLQSFSWRVPSCGALLVAVVAGALACQPPRAQLPACQRACVLEVELSTLDLQPKSIGVMRGPEGWPSIRSSLDEALGELEGGATTDGRGLPGTLAVTCDAKTPLSKLREALGRPKVAQARVLLLAGRNPEGKASFVSLGLWDSARAKEAEAQGGAKRLDPSELAPACPQGGVGGCPVGLVELGEGTCGDLVARLDAMPSEALVGLLVPQGK